MFNIKTFHGQGGPYLTVISIFEFLVKGQKYIFCIHFFHRGDEDPDCHDHPFDFWSLIIWGSYREHFGNHSSKNRQWLSFTYRKAIHKHRVELLSKRCITFCLKRKQNRKWGFYPGGRFVYWKDYIRKKGLNLIKD